MPALSFLVFVGLALIALLFFGKATLEPVPEMFVAHKNCNYEGRPQRLIIGLRPLQTSLNR
jgi:hypothetical protein